MPWRTTSTANRLFIQEPVRAKITKVLLARGFHRWLVLQVITRKGFHIKTSSCVSYKDIHCVNVSSFIYNFHCVFIHQTTWFECCHLIQWLNKINASYVAIQFMVNASVYKDKVLSMCLKFVMDGVIRLSTLIWLPIQIEKTYLNGHLSCF